MNAIDDKKKLCTVIEEESDKLFSLACRIFDHPECDYHETFAAEILTQYLSEAGFEVERGVGGLDTAFRAVFQNKEGGPSIGLLGEYDALKELGHGCGHHLQTPACIGAAMAIRSVLGDTPYRLVIYGTPAEESTGGKIYMLEKGCFSDIDFALNYHAGHAVSAAGKSTALQSMEVTFTGIPSHAAGAPEDGRSALDAMVLSFHGAECLREHVKLGSRIHYTIRTGTGPSNIVHEKAVAAYTLRSGDQTYLKDMLRRFRKVIEGAALMTETKFDIKVNLPYYDIVPIEVLCNTVYANAQALGYQNIDRNRPEGAGSSDFGNVSWHVPSVMLQTDYSAEPAHTIAWVKAGKTEAARRSMEMGAKLLAVTAYDLIGNGELRAKAREEFEKATRR